MSEYLGKVRKQSMTVSEEDGSFRGTARAKALGQKGAAGLGRRPLQRVQNGPGQSRERAQVRGRRWVTWDLAGHHEDSGFKLSSVMRSH